MPPIRKTIVILAAFALAPSFGAGQVIAPAPPMAAVPPAHNLPNALNLTTLEQIALERNPTLVQAGSQVRISRGKALQAGLHPNPTVGYAADQIGVEGTAGEFQGMFVEQQIITGGKLQLSRAKFIQEARQAELQVLAQRYRVVYGVRAAYYNTLARQRRLQLRRQLFQNSQDVTKTVEELVNVGQANRTDLLQAQLELQRAKANLLSAERRYQGAWEQLGAVIGEPDLPPSPLEGELDFDDQNRIDRETVLANLLTCSPQLRFAQAEVTRDRIALRRERAEPIPNLTVRAETGYNVEARDTVAGVEIGLNVPLFDKNQGTILQARAELTRAQAEVSRVEFMLRRQFAQAFAEYESALLLASSYRTEALPKAEEVYQLYLDSFQKRRAAWPQVLAAQREYLQLYEEYLDNVLDARHAEARINAFLLEDGLSQPPEPTPEGHRDATPRPR
jgi:cobalt-zinc-cadmium efflux system outer membrane protein